MPFLIWWAVPRGCCSVPAMIAKTPARASSTIVFLGAGLGRRAGEAARGAGADPADHAGRAWRSGWASPSCSPSPRRLTPAFARALHAGGAGHPDDAAGRADAAAGADARPRRGGDALDHRLGHLLPGLRDDRPGPGAGAARRPRPAACLRRRARCASCGSSRSRPRLPYLFAATRLDRAAGAARRDDRRMARHRHAASATSSTSRAATSTTA